MKAQKKPVIIDFIPYDDTDDNISFTYKLKDWVRSFNEDVDDYFYFDEKTNTIKVKTLEGTSYDVTSNDVIIRGIEGEYYPCKKDIFERTYDKIN